jgi:hypothetical protein
LVGIVLAIVFGFQPDCTDATKRNELTLKTSAPHADVFILSAFRIRRYEIRRLSDGPRSLRFLIILRE